MNFFLKDTSAHYTCNNLADCLHKVANTAEEEKKPYLSQNESICSLPWAGVHDKAPDKSNNQFMSEVTLISFVPIVKMLQKMQQNLSPYIWIPSRSTLLLYKAAKSFEFMLTSNRHRIQRNTVSWKYWNLTFPTLPYPHLQKSLLSLKSFCVVLSGVAAAITLSLLEYLCLHCFRKVVKFWRENWTGIWLWFSDFPS